jgi:hypothetical protein
MSKSKKLSKKENEVELSLKLSRRAWKLFSNRKIDLKEFFIESKLSPKKWYRLHEDHANPTFHSICEIAAALKVHPKELLNFDMDQRIRKVKKKWYGSTITVIEEYTLPEHADSNSK